MNIQFHSIDKFGYFRRTVDNDQIAFVHAHASIETILLSMKNWIDNNSLDIEDTTTIGDAEAEYSGAKNVYCYSLSKFTNSSDFLLITWNEIENHGTSVCFLKKNAKVGSGAIQEATPGKDFIPGYPSYFWFIPDKNIFATLKIKNMSTATFAMKQYIKNFMKFVNPDYITRKKNETKAGDSSVLIYGGDEKFKPRFSFNDSIILKNSDLEFLKQNSDKFQGIRCSTELSRSVAIEEGIIDNVFSFLGFTNKQKKACKFKFQVDYDFEKQDITNLYKKFGGATNDSLGFILDDKVYWLKDMQARCKGSSAGLMKDRHIVDQDKLVNYLERNRENLFSQANIGG